MTHEMSARGRCELDPDLPRIAQYLSHAVAVIPSLGEMLRLREPSSGFGQNTASAATWMAKRRGKLLSFLNCSGNKNASKRNALISLRRRRLGFVTETLRAQDD